MADDLGCDDTEITTTITVTTSASAEVDICSETTASVPAGECAAKEDSVCSSEEVEEDICKELDASKFDPCKLTEHKKVKVCKGKSLDRKVLDKFDCMSKALKETDCNLRTLDWILNQYTFSGPRPLSPVNVLSVCKPDFNCNDDEPGPCPPKVDLCPPPCDPCPPRSDPCTSKPDPCAAKPDPCAPRPDPCKQDEHSTQTSDVHTLDIAIQSTLSKAVGTTVDTLRDVRDATTSTDKIGPGDKSSAKSSRSSLKSDKKTVVFKGKHKTLKSTKSRLSRKGGESSMESLSSEDSNASEALANSRKASTKFETRLSGIRRKVRSKTTDLTRVPRTLKRSDDEEEESDEANVVTPAIQESSSMVKQLKDSLDKLSSQISSKFKSVNSQIEAESGEIKELQKSTITAANLQSQAKAAEEIEMKEMKSSLDELTRHKTAMDSKIQVMRSDNLQKDKQISDLSLKMSAMQKERAQLEDTRSELSGKLQETLRTCMEVNLEAEKINAKLQAAKRNLIRSQKNKAKLREKSLRIIHKLKTYAIKKSTELKQSRATVKELEAQICEMNREKDVLMHTLADLKKNFCIAMKRLDQCKAEIDKLNKMNAEKDKMINELKRCLEENENALKNMSQQFDRIQSSYIVPTEEKLGQAVSEEELTTAKQLSQELAELYQCEKNARMEAECEAENCRQELKCCQELLQEEITKGKLARIDHECQMNQLKLEHKLELETEKQFMNSILMTKEADLTILCEKYEELQRKFSAQCKQLVCCQQQNKTLSNNLAQACADLNICRNKNCKLEEELHAISMREQQQAAQQGQFFTNMQMAPGPGPFQNPNQQFGQNRELAVLKGQADETKTMMQCILENVKTLDRICKRCLKGGRLDSSMVISSSDSSTLEEMSIRFLYREIYEKLKCVQDKIRRLCCKTRKLQSKMNTSSTTKSHKESPTSKSTFSGSKALHKVNTHGDDSSSNASYTEHNRHGNKKNAVCDQLAGIRGDYKRPKAKKNYSDSCMNIGRSLSSSCTVVHTQQSDLNLNQAQIRITGSQSEGVCGLGKTKAHSKSKSSQSKQRKSSSHQKSNHSSVESLDADQNKASGSGMVKSHTSNNKSGSGMDKSQNKSRENVNKSLSGLDAAKTGSKLSEISGESGDNEDDGGGKLSTATDKRMSRTPKASKSRLGGTELAFNSSDALNLQKGTHIGGASRLAKMGDNALNGMHDKLNDSKVSQEVKWTGSGGPAPINQSSGKSYGQVQSSHEGAVTTSQAKRAALVYDGSGPVNQPRGSMSAGMMGGSGGGISGTGGGSGGGIMGGMSGSGGGVMSGARLGVSSLGPAGASGIGHGGVSSMGQGGIGSMGHGGVSSMGQGGIGGMGHGGVSSMGHGGVSGLSAGGIFQSPDGMVKSSGGGVGSGQGGSGGVACGIEQLKEGAIHRVDEITGKNQKGNFKITREIILIPVGKDGRNVKCALDYCKSEVQKLNSPVTCHETTVSLSPVSSGPNSPRMTFLETTEFDRAAGMQKSRTCFNVKPGSSFKDSDCKTTRPTNISSFQTVFDANNRLFDTKIHTKCDEIPNCSNEYKNSYPCFPLNSTPKQCVYKQRYPPNPCTATRRNNSQGFDVGGISCKPGCSNVARNRQRLFSSNSSGTDDCIKFCGSPQCNSTELPANIEKLLNQVKQARRIHAKECSSYCEFCNP